MADKALYIQLNFTPWQVVGMITPWGDKNEIFCSGKMFFKTCTVTGVHPATVAPPNAITP